MKESRREAFERIAQDLTPGALEELVRFLAHAVQSIEAGERVEALSHITRVMGAIGVLHSMIFLEVPSWCPPSSRAAIGQMLMDLRREIDVLKRLRDSGGDPPVRPPRKLMN